MQRTEFYRGYTLLSSAVPLHSCDGPAVWLLTEVRGGTLLLLAFIRSSATAHGWSMGRGWRGGNALGEWELVCGCFHGMKWLCRWEWRRNFISREIQKRSQKKTKKQQQINKQSGGGSVGGDVRERKKRTEMRRQSLVCDSEQCRKMSGGEDGGRLICSRTKRWVTLNMMDQPSFEEEINNAGHDLKSTDSSYDKRLSSSLTKKIDKFKVIIKYKTEKTQKKEC